MLNKPLSSFMGKALSSNQMHVGHKVLVVSERWWPDGSGGILASHLIAGLLSVRDKHRLWLGSIGFLSLSADLMLCIFLGTATFLYQLRRGLARGFVWC